MNPLQKYFLIFGFGLFSSITSAQQLRFNDMLVLRSLDDTSLAYRFIQDRGFKYSGVNYDDEFNLKVTQWLKGSTLLTYSHKESITDNISDIQINCMSYNQSLYTSIIEQIEALDWKTKGYKLTDDGFMSKTYTYTIKELPVNYRAVEVGYLKTNEGYTYKIVLW